MQTQRPFLQDVLATALGSLPFAVFFAVSLPLSAQTPLPPPDVYDPSLQAIPIVFSNITNEREDSDIWINLVGGGLPTSAADAKIFDPNGVIGYYYDTNGIAQSLTTNSSLKLADLSGGSNAQTAIYLYGWTSGRLYISYDSRLSSLSPTYTPTGGPYNGWQPGPTTETMDPNFQVRHQSVELSVIPQHNETKTAFTDVNEIWTNTTYIDYTAISLGMQAHDSSATHPTQWSKTTQEMTEAVAIARPQSGYTPNTNILTVGYYKQEGDSYVTSPTPQEGYSPILQLPGEEASSDPNHYKNPVTFLPPNGPLPSPNFLRVTGPGLIGTIGSAGGPTAVYHDWSAYLTALAPGGDLNLDKKLTTKLAGTYGDVGGPIGYDLNATFSAGTTTIGGVSYTGYVKMEGEIDGNQVKIVIPYAELQKSEGIYGANPHYSINDGSMQPPLNDVYTWIVGDLVAGLNLGLVGSQVEVTLNGVDGKIGVFTSSEWWEIANLNDGQYQFDGAQPGNDEFYNPYSAALRHVTSGYNFAYTDRLGDSLTSFILNPQGAGAYTDAWLEIMIQPDFIPEPSSLALLLGGAGGWLLFHKRRRKSCQD